jgi:hypothetical protein
MFKPKKEGHIMRYSKFLFVLTFMFISGLTQATLANCPACMGEQPDWTESATAFLEPNLPDQVGALTDRSQL